MVILSRILFTKLNYCAKMKSFERRTKEGDLLMEFFSPTTVLKELRLLQHIEIKPDTTQQEISSVIGGAVSMVNLYVDRLEKNGYMTRSYKSAKIVYYNISAEGIKRKNYLLINYMNELLELYKLAKENVDRFLIKIEAKGYKNILLYGAGEVAETILGVIRDGNSNALNILAVIDDNRDLQGMDILGFKIISREEIYKFDADGLVVTSYAYEDEILEKLKEFNYSEDNIIRFFNY